MMIHRSNQKREAATIVEFAAVASVFVLIFFGIFEFCMAVYAYNIVEAAAREGCRYGVVNVTDTTMIADTQNTTKTFMCGLEKWPGYSCNVYLADSSGTNIGTATTAKFGEYVCVDVQVTYVPMTPGLGFLKTFTLRSKCSMGSEAN